MDMSWYLGVGYTLKHSWLIQRGKMAEYENILFFHPYDLIPIVQKFYGSDAALDLLRKIIHYQIDTGVFKQF